MSTAPEPASVGRPLSAIFAIVAMAIAIMLAWVPYRLPDALDRTAADDMFSAARASRHLEVIAHEPRPAGSRAHRQVQRYLLAQIEALGLQADVQQTTQVAPDIQWMNVAARVFNIAARIEGRGRQGDAVLLMAHYDSVSTSPGANDNAVAVASLLEIARAIKARGAPGNDVIMLFTDAEEDGLLGARAFVASHPWAKDVRLVINLEARGSRGPSILFETSAGNDRLIDALRASTPGAIGSSLFYEVYKRLPNDTDYTAFRQEGFAGMNFAYVGGVTAYHTRIDDIASVDPRLVQQHGGNALALATHLAESDLDSIRSDGDAVFFNLPFAGMVGYSAALALPLAGIAALLVAIALVFAIRRGRARPGRVVAALALQPVAILMVTAVVSLLWYAVAALLWPAQRWMPIGEPYAGAAIFVTLLVLSIALLMALQGRLRRRFGMIELWGGALAFWALIAIALSAAWPGASYAALWPVVASALAMLLVSLRPAPSLVGEFSTILASVFIIVLIAPLVWLLYQGLTLSVVAVPLAVALLGMGLMLPTFEAIRAAAPKLSVLVPGVFALLAFAAIPLLQDFDARQPRPESLSFVANASSGKAAWFSSDQQPGPWTAHYLGESPTHSALDLFGAMDYPFLVALSDPPAQMLSPTIELLSDATTAGKRHIRIKVASRRGGEQLWISLPPAPRVISASVDGFDLAGADPKRDSPWSLRFIAPPATGIELALEVEPGKALEITAVDRTRGLPDLPIAKHHPRPENSMSPRHLEEFQESTFIASSIILPIK